MGFGVGARRPWIRRPARRRVVLTFLGPGLLAATCVRRRRRPSRAGLSTARCSGIATTMPLPGTPMRCGYRAGRTDVDCRPSADDFGGLRHRAGGVWSRCGRSRCFAAIPAALLTGLGSRVRSGVRRDAQARTELQRVAAVHRHAAVPLLGTFFPNHAAADWSAVSGDCHSAVSRRRADSRHRAADATWSAGLVHAGFLAALCAAGCAVAVWTFSRRLYVDRVTARCFATVVASGLPEGRRE